MQSLPLGVSVITADEIRASGAATVNEALMRILGVVGRQDFYGGGEYNLDLRGFGGTADNNQLVIVDGLRVSEADLGGTRLAGIPIESVERIEILRGSGAVLYGEGATGGVIVITTKAGSGAERRNTASAYAAAGSHGLRDLRANATVSGGGFSLDVSGQKRDTDNHRDNFRSESDALSATAQWANDWLRLGARAGRDTLDTRLPGALTLAQYEANPRQSTKPDDRADIRNQRTSVFAEAQLGSWQLAADAGQREKSLTSLNSGFPFDYDIDAASYGLRARNQVTAGGVRNLLVLGTDYARWTRDVLGAVRLHRQPVLARLVPQGRRDAGRRHALFRRLAHREDRQGQHQRGRGHARPPARLGTGREPPVRAGHDRLRARRPQLSPRQRGRVRLHLARHHPGAADLARPGAGRALGLCVGQGRSACVPQPAGQRDRLRPERGRARSASPAPTSTSIPRAARGWSWTPAMRCRNRSRCA